MPRMNTPGPATPRLPHMAIVRGYNFVISNCPVLCQARRGAGDVDAGRRAARVIGVATEEDVGPMGHRACLEEGIDGDQQ